MLIQCHSCNTKYRLNLENIPKRKTFVRCKNCGTPIFIDPTEEDAPQGGVIPPRSDQDSQPEHQHDGAGGTGGNPMVEGVQVVCPECKSRYRVESASLRRPGIKLKCTQCGALFAPPQSHAGEPAAKDATGKDATGKDGTEKNGAEKNGTEKNAPGLDAPEFYPPPSQDTYAEPAEPEMPVPDDQRVDSMFDDLRPDHGALQQQESIGDAGAAPKEHELGSLKGTDFEDEPPVPDSQQAYMDAVSFAADDGIESLPSGGTVPDDQKFKFFLNPKAQEKDPGEEALPEMPDLDASSEDAIDAESPELPDDLPPLPVVREEESEESGPESREVVPGQPAKIITEPRALGILAAASLGILIGAGIWGWWLTTSTQNRDPFRIQNGKVHQLSLPDNQQGHFVRNIPSGKRLFVVNGKIENRFDNTHKVRWIRLKGMVFGGGEEEKPKSLAFAYAGNLLKDGQLSKWSLADIRAYYGFNNGRENINFEIPSGALVPYQLVFTDIGSKVGKTVTEVVSYHRGGEAVFIDSP